MSLNSATLVGVDKLADGETAGGLLCPRCSGGTSKEHSFSVTKTRGKLLYHCHRATCGYSGAEYLSSLDRELDNESSQKVPRSGDLFFRALKFTGDSQGLGTLVLWASRSKTISRTFGGRCSSLNAKTCTAWTPRY